MNSFENLPDLQREQLLDLANRFTTKVVDTKGNLKGNAFIADGRVISAHHVVDGDYVIYNSQIGPGVMFEQVQNQDIAESPRQLRVSGLKRAKNQGDGQKVYLISRDKDNIPLVVSGEIMTMGPIHRGKMEVSVDRQQMTEILNGMSGSAVTNLSGEAIGVLVQARMGGKGLMEPFK